MRKARAALGTGEARSLLEECGTFHLLDEVDLRGWLAHLADAAREDLVERRGAPGLPGVADTVELAGEQITLGALLGEPTRWVEPLRRDVLTRAANELDRARREVELEGDAVASRVLARGPALERPELDLEAWLSLTDEATHEALERTLFALGLPAKEREISLPRALRAEALDAAFPRTRRIARLARALEVFGADPRTASRLRIEEHAAATLRSDLAPIDPPARVAIALPTVELGLGSELLTLEALGRGLALAMVSPALGLEHRRLPSAPVPPALGALLVLLPTDARFLSRQLELDARAVASIRPVASYLALVRMRLELARLAFRKRGLSAKDDHAHALAARALGATSDLPAGPLLVSSEPTPLLEASARAASAAPVLFTALRERHDEDFFRNPRTLDTIAGAAARGARLGLEEWLAELGAPLEQHAERAQAWMREAVS